MRVRLFYPFAFALITAMVLIALRPGLERAQEWSSRVKAIATQGFVVDGAQLSALIVNERASIDHGGPEDAPFATIGSSGLVTPEENNGAHYLLPPDAVEEIKGREVDVLFDIRSSPDAGSEIWYARAAIPGIVDTGWRELPASADWSTQEIRLAIPSHEGDQTLDVILWSDALGDAGRIDLRRLSIMPIGTRTANNG